MQNNQVGTFSWDLTQISSALHISEADAKAYFKDGRRVSFIMERRIAYEFLDGSVSPSEGAGYDVIDKQKNKWEVRSISRGGIYFCPSYMVGSGRSFVESGFKEKLDEIAGYIVSDIESFPTVPFWVIPTETVRGWWESGTLGKNTKISRRKALSLLEKI